MNPRCRKIPTYTVRAPKCCKYMQTPLKMGGSNSKMLWIPKWQEPYQPSQPSQPSQPCILCPKSGSTAPAAQWCWTLSPGRTAHPVDPWSRRWDDRWTWSSRFSSWLLSLGFLGCGQVTKMNQDDKMGELKHPNMGICLRKWWVTMVSNGMLLV